MLARICTSFHQFVRTRINPVNVEQTKMFSADEARDILETQRLNIRSDSSVIEINLLVQEVVGQIEAIIRKTTDAKRGECNVCLVGCHSNGSGNIVLERFRAYRLNSTEENQLCSVVAKKVTSILTKNGYRVNPAEGSVSTRPCANIRWSTKHARDFWNIVLAHLTIRAALKKYIRSRLDEWLMPPNGQLYLRANTEFHKNN